MSEEGYIKAPCQECEGRISLPQDAVGVDFNCPHCGAGLQMLLKHICEHCGGKLSFDGTPEAIGMEIECGHCHNATVLKPSTFAMDGAGTSAESSEEEEYEDEEEFEEEAYEDEIPEPETETRRRTGPPKPRQPKRTGPPKPRHPKRAGGASADSHRPGQPPEKIDRRLAGTEPAEEEPAEEGRRSRPKPKRRAGSGGARPGPTPRPMAGATQQLDEDPSDPMSGDLPGGPVATPGSGGPPGATPVQRRVAGAKPPEESMTAASPQPTFKAAPSEEVEELEGDDGPWYKNKEKKKLAIVGGVFLAVFLLVGLPGLGVYPGPLSLFSNNDNSGYPTDKVKFDDESFKIEIDAKNKSVFYITGMVRNTSDTTLDQVELRFRQYDSGGAKLGETLAFTNKLGPNMEWHFRAVTMFTNVARVDLAGVVVR